MNYTYFPTGPTGPGTPGSVPIEQLLTQRIELETRGAELHKTTWQQWKTSMPAYSHALFDGGVSAQHVTAVTGFSIDQDNAPPGVVEAICQRHGIAFYRWDTASKQVGLKEHAYRYLIIFDSPLHIAPSDYKTLWLALTAYFGGTNDPQTKNIDRKMFLPATVNGVPPNLVFQPGTTFDPLGVPAAPVEETPERDLFALPRPQLLRALDMVIKSTKDVPTKLALQSLKKGEEFAVSTRRHEAILTLTRVLVNALPDVSTDCIASLFEASLAGMNTDQTMRDVEAAIDGAREKFVGRTERRRSALIRAARTDGLSHEYTLDERRDMAAWQGVSPSELDDRILVYRGNEIYALTHRNGYEGPYVKQTGALLQQLLAPWGYEDCAREALERYGLGAKSVIYSIALKKSVYNSHTGVLRLASAAPEITFAPREHPDVAAWLDAFDSPKLLDWLACAPDPEKAVCGLGIYGPRGSGKNLLAIGLARLWGNGTPADPHEVFETNYDAGLAENAVLHIDEYTPNKYGRPVTGVLRQIIGSYKRALSVKYAQPIGLEGYTRVVLTGNDNLPLALDEGIGRQAQEAISERILAIELDESMPRTLARYDAAAFGLHKIAEHTLWLAATRTVKKQSRFWVEGDMDKMMARLIVSNRPTANVAEWIVRFVTGTYPLNGTDAPYWGQRDGRLAISGELLTRRWGLIRDDKYRPSASTIKEQLSVLSVDGKTDRNAKDANGNRRRLFVLDTGKLATLATELCICDEEQDFLTALSAKISAS